MQVRTFFIPLVCVTALLFGGTAWGHPGDSAIDPDHDGWTVVDGDNCPDSWNASQQDTDADGAGDVCDTDDDADNVDDASDNCGEVANGDQSDADLDGSGDACDSDDDNDGAVDSRDNCPVAANADQKDSDSDGKGDACDPAPKPAAPGAGGPPAEAGGGALARVSVARSQGLAQLVGGGLAVAVSCSQACGISARLVADAATARRLGLGRRRTLAQATWSLGGAARTWVFLEPTAGTRRKLGSARRAGAVLETTVSDAAGNRRRVVRRVTFRG